MSETRKRDHNFAAMVKAILKLPIEERVISATVDDDSYRFETTRVYQSDCYGHKADTVVFSNDLKVWHAVDFIHSYREATEDQV